jgi:hypothetical protein
MTASKFAFYLYFKRLTAQICTVNLVYSAPGKMQTLMARIYALTFR